MASTITVQEIRLDTNTDHSLSTRSETPSPVGPLLASPSLKGSTTPVWLKLNSAAPIYVEVDKTPVAPQNEPFTGAKKLRYLLENTDELIVCPGVYDGLSARTAMELGFKALYMVSSRTLVDMPVMTLFSRPPPHLLPLSRASRPHAHADINTEQTGAGTTASRLGQPDLAIAQLQDMRENADMIANLDPFGPPLIADMDTGYGG